MAAIARASDTKTPRQTGLRFPCGHVAGAKVVNRRMRSTPTAVWVPCPRCNLVALLATGPSTQK